MATHLLVAAHMQEDPMKTLDKAIAALFAPFALVLAIGATSMTFAAYGF